VVKTPGGVLPLKNDSSNLAPPDSIPPIPGDTLKPDSVKAPPPKGDIETTINYSAKDSIVATLNNQKILLYGDAKIKYGEIELEAQEIEIDYANNTLTAHGIRDSLGQRIGYPIFKNGPELYETKDIIYNFKTKKARISEVVTQQGEGYLHSEIAFKNEKNEILSIRNSYTTCNLEHPHFRIRLTKAKAIPNDKIVSGPFYMEFNDIPLPFAGFLFGMFPSPRKSSSGIIVPSYGEERRRGFNLRNGGYFFDISEYAKLALTGDIYSKGGHALYANSSYMKRYKYNGTVNFAYSKNPDQDDRIETESFTQDFRLTWSHSPQSKGTGRFSASVNAATATFNRNNFLAYGTANPQSSALSNISTKLSSNVSYSKRFSGTPFSMGLNVNHNQDLVTKNVDLSLPTLTLNMTNIYPLQKKGGGGGSGPRDNFSLSYAMTASNRVTNNLGRLTPEAERDSIMPFTLANLPRLIESGKKGIRHTIPASFSFKALRHFTVSPSVNYEERWYGERLRWYNMDGNIIAPKDSVVKEFNRIANYSFSTSMNTRLYGMYLVKNKSRKLKAIRHVVNPSISYSYTPDFSGNRGYFDKVTDNAGNVVLKSRHEGYVYGGSNIGKSSSMGFSLGNNLEAKIQGVDDSVARKVMLLNNLSLGTSYNFEADSFNLAPISIAANTNILDNLINLNLSGTLDPYHYGPDTRIPENAVQKERRYDDLDWKNGRLGRITNATLALSSNLNPKARSKETSTREKIGKSDLPQQEKDHLIKNPDAYIDFDIPWSLNLSYNLNYSHPLNSSPKVTQTLNGSGDFSLSEKWKFTYSTGYHFEAKEFTQTTLGISRDLHCWTMNVNWVPFGPFQSLYFVINVKASILQDLKLERRKPFFDNL
jgi:hypothetical protein